MLTDPAFGPDGLAAAAAVADGWFANEASVASFVCRSVLRDMTARDMGDQQCPAGEWDRFRADVLPRFTAVLDAIPGDPSGPLADLVIGYHSSI